MEPVKFGLGSPYSRLASLALIVMGALVTVRVPLVASVVVGQHARRGVDRGHDRVGAHVAARRGRRCVRGGYGDRCS